MRRQPFRLALAILECWAPGDDALRGDLVEELKAGRSQWWFWRQVIAAVLYRRPVGLPERAQAEAWLVAAAILLVLSFQAVFVTEAAYRLVADPPMQDVRGYLYLLDRITIEPPPSGLTPLASLYAGIGGLIVAIPVGWLVGRLHRDHPRLAIGVLALGTHTWAAINVPSPLAIRVLSMLALVVGTLLVGCIAVAAAGGNGRSPRQPAGGMLSVR
jgi:hypothetical protein